MLPIATRKWYRFFIFFFSFQKRRFSLYFSVIYVKTCESGSIFEGLMPQDQNIYFTTAANPVENSWRTYCPGMDPSPPS